MNLSNHADLCPTKSELIEIYKKISLLKQTNEKIPKAIASKTISSFFYHSSRGQEIIPSAVSVLLKKEDYICTIYRGIHDSLAKGVPSKLIWAELAGKVTGLCKGKGGPMHIAFPEMGVMVVSAIVGSSLPIANGLALAAQIRGEDRVTVVYFGEGAANIGAFHEALNMASIWNLPVVYICQNNRFSLHTRSAKMTASNNVSHRASAYQIPGITVDGNNPLEVFSAAKKAINRARNGHGPSLIEANTFRFFGHVIDEDQGYIPNEERTWAMTRDPVPLYRNWLIEQEISGSRDLDAIDKSIENEIDEAIRFAVDSKFPDIDELNKDIY